MATHNIDFEPVGRRGQCQDDESLLACARRLGVSISSVCGGRGTCRTCRVQVVSGGTAAATAHERAAFTPQELEAGWRLACQARPVRDCKLSIPPESMPAPQRMLVESRLVGMTVPLEPPVRAYAVELSAPALSDPRADADRLLDAIERQHGLRCHNVDVGVLRMMPDALRSGGWRCQAAVRGTEVVALSPSSSAHLGLAVDLGTTKIAGYLVDLGTGMTLASAGAMNPQIAHGEDAITRLAAAIGSAGEAERLHKLALEAVNEMAVALCAQAGCQPAQIAETVVVGNTAMHHLFLGLPVAHLARSPFIPAVTGPVDVKARELGLDIAPGAYVHLLPNIAGFVGGDHVAALLATEPWRPERPVLLLDIGTNTEVSLTKDGATTAVSCASGPAFEGGHIKDGMRAAPGAIERLRIADGDVQYQTIDNALPVGICGSGILDSVAQFYLAGVVDQGGRLRDGHPRMRSRGEQREFVLVSERERSGHPAVSVTQRDIREVQLAKAAIRAGIQVLLEAAGCTEEDLGQVIIAGALGTYIDVSSAIAVGMLPPLPLDRFRQVGNAAGAGARLALVSIRKRAEAQALASRVSYVELGNAPAFGQTFLQASALGRYRLAHGKREAIE
ncbi:MAG: DUF4445 domain-containing protein [Chloroflexi bacterium]|nr:DUF4445 domain-containing protein [Chloroflexota bacterium]